MLLFILLKTSLIVENKYTKWKHTSMKPYLNALGSMMPGVPAGGGQMSLSSMPPTAMGVFTAAGP